MSHGLLEILRYFLLALIWLFFIYASRMVIVEVRRGRAEAAPTGEGAESGAQRQKPRRVDPLHLRVLEPRERRGERVELAGEITLGRSAGCAISLDGDTFASSIHARLFPRNGEVFVEDLGSTNGTYLNGERLAAPARIQRGDRVKVGKTVLEVTR